MNIRENQVPSTKWKRMDLENIPLKSTFPLFSVASTDLATDH
jgi:hypothetical protein